MDEEDVNTKERMLLVLNVLYQGKISAAHVAKYFHRNRTWACVWLKRYEKEDLEGLKNNPRTGRISSELAEEDICSIKTTLKESNHSWLDHETSRRVNRKEERNKISLYSHISHTL